MNWAYREKRWRKSGGVLVISQKEAENGNTEGQKGMMENLKKNSAVICIHSHTGRKQKVHNSASATEQAKARRWAIMLN